MKKNEISALICPQNKYPEPGTRKRVEWEIDRIQKGIEAFRGMLEITEAQAADSHTEELLNGNLEVCLDFKDVISSLENRLFELELSLPRIPKPKIKKQTILGRLLCRLRIPKFRIII